MKLDPGALGELRVLDSGYTDQVLLDTINEEVLRIKATVCNSLQDLNRLYMVDRALYTNTPGIPLYMEFTLTTSSFRKKYSPSLTRVNVRNDNCS